MAELFWTTANVSQVDNRADEETDVSDKLLSSNFPKDFKLRNVIIATLNETSNKLGTMDEDERSIESDENGEKVEKIDVEVECKRKCVHWTKIIWSFVSFWISVADVTVIIYLSYLHFHHSSDIIAWLMLLPILMNFIGIFTFLSDDDERHEMEKLGCQSMIWKNLMFFPVLGPSVSSLKLFILSFREHEADRFERLESLLTRMKQYESFFRAAPEAFVQLTFRIITWSRAKVFHEEDYWVNLCLTLCIFALAESNMYSTAIPYYRMFTRIKTEDAWKIDHISLPWRVKLFFFNFLSIESRLYADAIMKAAACFYFSEYSFGEVLIVTFLCQFVVRAGLHSFFVGFLGSKRQKKELRETGVYGAFTYAWRSLFLSFDYQSYCPAVFLSFYIENFVLICGSYVVILTWTDVDLSDKYVFNIYAAVSLLSMVVAIFLRIRLRKISQMRTCEKNKVKAYENE